MMTAMVSRQGRQFQRYNNSGRRRVVGCIPYKFNLNKSSSEGVDKRVEVLVISSQKGYGMMFPKGGWEKDENIEQAALREAWEEAGVQGDIESELGKWSYKSKSQDIMHEGVMFPLNVTEELVRWPEMNVRKRQWVSVEEVKKGCPHSWMIDALDRLIARLRHQSMLTDNIFN
ncbi:nudix hydrolase 17, mitochondrial-like [Dioscorea cayenensis subsp. rotundata]|uniref:Nudix hydrolase 17, mitochondrial-like n=1 Tax=Dioscorea cayennensis subsp. rotundata TaxID=55577 RepID=A0AB40BA29_DIOCR|nr:nudix hydrolase 17, mitochondrial-like [Dioscorea cayenensis subsp. rotundata]